MVIKGNTHANLKLVARARGFGAVGEGEGVRPRIPEGTEEESRMHVH